MSKSAQSKLDALLENVKVQNKTNKNEISKYLSSIPISKRKEIEDLENKGYTIFEIKNNQPQYRKVFNSDAAIAMEVDAVRAGGELGLTLDGEGMNIGIWDGGLIRTTHQEYEGRIKYFDSSGSTVFSNHATGVAGTLLGTGLNPNARGMAPMAEGIAYNFINDTQEMIEAQMLREIVVSNHSYGLITGWNDGQWFGDESISDQEDWRFGFYDTNARTWDQIAIASPNYLIVKSAGNDRGDSGSGPYPSDGPYDSVAGASCAKNVLIVGAARKSTQGYENPNFINMSSFSGWGPTDDGRIKPDVVSIGVDIFTAAANDNEDYQTTSGTSFSSPAACGGLALVQELSQELTSSFLKAASLKALAIHTATQTGEEGPDYRFGWGLLNIKKACSYLLNRNQTDKQIVEANLSNNETAVFEIKPKDNTPVRVTIVWTDVSGNPVSASLDPIDLMLINDLDIRIKDENGNAYMPYILDPSNPALNATTGDNFRDNVEQIFIENAEERTYFVEVSHKGTLEGGSQDYSIIIDFESSDISLTNLFWIGGEGNWSDPAHWSLSSGGTTANMTPGLEHRVIIDDNSMLNGSSIFLDSNTTVGAISSFTNDTYTFDLGNFELTNHGGLSMSSDLLTIKNGTIIQTNDEALSQNINLDNSQSENFNLILPKENNGQWVMLNATVHIGNLIINGGSLSIDNVELNVGAIKTDSDNGMPTFNMTNSNLYLRDEFDIENMNDFNANRASRIYVENTDQDFELKIGDRRMNIPLSIINSIINIESSNSVFSEISTAFSSFNLINDLTVEIFNSEGTLDLGFNNGETLTVLNEMSLRNDSETVVINDYSGNVSEIFIEYRDKLCFDNMIIDNVNLAGNASVSVGTNSTLTNSSGWSELECSQLLFSDFEGQYLCTNGFSEFNDLSQGQIDSWEWSVDGVITSTNQHLTYSFDNIGEYEVGLLVSDTNGNSSRFVQAVSIAASTLDPNRVIESNATTLASLKLADAYQWYKNGNSIPGETGRTYQFNGEEGSYCVVTFDSDCNRKSEVLNLGVTNVEESDLASIVDIFPNPTSNNLTLRFYNISDFNYAIYDALGQKKLSNKVINSPLIHEIDLNEILPGIYFVRMKINQKTYAFKITKI
ncbi:MAG: S8 family serine peptidase [Saprospiraceae bacterium]|nr:S8 family serine peptidase [Saprospiraceae bacterium]